MTRIQLIEYLNKDGVLMKMGTKTEGLENVTFTGQTEGKRARGKQRVNHVKGLR